MCVMALARDVEDPDAVHMVQGADVSPRGGEKAAALRVDGSQRHVCLGVGDRQSPSICHCANSVVSCQPNVQAGEGAQVSQSRSCVEQRQTHVDLVPSGTPETAQRLARAAHVP